MSALRRKNGQDAHAPLCRPMTQSGHLARSPVPRIQLTSGRHASKFSRTGFARARLATMHKLLVPVDGSDNAMHALEHAIRLAKEYGSLELVVLYAHEPPIVYGELAIYVPEEKLKELQRKHGEDISRPSIETAQRAGVTFHEPYPVRRHFAINRRMRQDFGLRWDCDGNTRHGCDRQSGRGVCCNEGRSPHQTSGHARKVALSKTLVVVGHEMPDEYARAMLNALTNVRFWG